MTAFFKIYFKFKIEHEKMSKIIKNYPTKNLFNRKIQPPRDTTYHRYALPINIHIISHYI